MAGGWKRFKWRWHASSHYRAPLQPRVMARTKQTVRKSTAAWINYEKRRREVEIITVQPPMPTVQEGQVQAQVLPPKKRILVFK
jgi:hypothetical protein